MPGTIGTMRVMLQNKLTSHYIREKGQWTPYSWEALDFGSYENAVAFVRENQLTNVQLELGYIQTGQKIYLPLEPSGT
jgi:hypothetical protein